MSERIVAVAGVPVTSKLMAVRDEAGDPTTAEGWVVSFFQARPAPSIMIVANRIF